MKHYPLILLFIFPSIGLIIMKLSGTKKKKKKKLVDKTKNGENVPSLEVIEVV